MKKNIYILLTIFCILFIILIQNLAVINSTPTKEFQLSIDEEKFKLSPYGIILVILILIYLVIFFIGIVNLIIFGIKKLKKKPLVSIQETEKKIPLSEGQMSKLLFLISFLVLIIYLLPVIINVFKWVPISINPAPLEKDFITGPLRNFISNGVNLILLLNMTLQVGTVILILRYINIKFLGFYLNKKQFIFLLRIYSAIVPLILLSLLLNILIIKNLSIKYSPSPVMELFFILNNKITMSILIIQVIILGPIAEELFFRGFIYKLGRTRYTFMVSAALTSLLFAFIHQVPQNVLPLFFISIALCYVYEKTQNILPSIIFHSIHNFISLTFFLVIKNLL